MSRVLRPSPAWADRSGFVQLGGNPAPVHPVVYQAVTDRFHRYCWGFDERRADVLADCFTEDGVWEANVMDETVVGPFVGREEVMEWLTRYWDVQRDQRRHMITNIVISRATDEEVTVVGYVLLVGSRHASSRLESAGVYELSCRSFPDSHWRIARLRAGFDSPYWKQEVHEMSPEDRRLFGITSTRAQAASDE